MKLKVMDDNTLTFIDPFFDHLRNQKVIGGAQ